ncbi:hypothetical protein [Ferrimonas marina]|uniref:Lipoprotein n=1 Tax=Ferrimonas marina TaxID=299255 RepID=A0A1M5YSW7_9GAMM|nr:hypothetical protein [Ferrimonas marina]SHI14934.1 hypothetical protein SAMN02745129_4374 [Ferrimonas marina]
MRCLLLCTTLLLSGCASSDNLEFLFNELVSGVLSGASQSDVGYGNPRCDTVRVQCSGQYEQWRNSNGQIGCACNH